MTADVTLQQIDQFHADTGLLADRIRRSDHLGIAQSSDIAVPPAVFEEIEVALEELRAAEEELRSQNRALSTAEGAIELERRRYQELFDFAPDAYFITDPRGVIQEANHAVSSLVGFARRYIIRKPLAAFVAPDEQQEFRTRLARLQSAEGTAVQEWEQRLRPRRYDHALVAAVRVAPVRNPSGVLVALRWMLRDVTAHKQIEVELHALAATLEQRIKERTAQLDAANRVNAAWLAQEQAALAAAEDRNRRLFARARDGLFHADPDGRLRAVNPALARMLGFASPEALLQTYAHDPSSLIAPLHRGELREILLTTGTLDDAELIARHQDGHERRLRLSAWTVLDATGTITAIEGAVVADD